MANLTLRMILSFQKTRHSTVRSPTLTKLQYEVLTSDALSIKVASIVCGRAININVPRPDKSESYHSHFQLFLEQFQIRLLPLRGRFLLLYPAATNRPHITHHSNRLHHANSVYHNSHNASVIRYLPVPVSAKLTLDINIH